MTDESEIAPDATPPLAEWRTLDALRAQLEAELFNLNKAALFKVLASAGVTHVQGNIAAFPIAGSAAAHAKVGGTA